MISEAPKYGLGDWVSIKDCSWKGVIIKVIVANNKDWPHKYKVQGKLGALTFNEESIVLKARCPYV